MTLVDLYPFNFLIPEIHPHLERQNPFLNAFCRSFIRTVGVIKNNIFKSENEW